MSSAWMEWGKDSVFAEAASGVHARAQLQEAAAHMVETQEREGVAAMRNYADIRMSPAAEAPAVCDGVGVMRDNALHAERST